MAARSRVELRPIESRDAEATADLHLTVWEEAYAGLIPASVLAERRAHRDQHVARWQEIAASSPTSGPATTVATHDGELVGFVSVGAARDDDIDLAEELWALYVRAAWWGQGVGRRLLVEALAERPAYLWVLGGNERGIGFYQRHGFALDDATRQNRACGTELRMVRR